MPAIHKGERCDWASAHLAWVSPRQQTGPGQQITGANKAVRAENRTSHIRARHPKAPVDDRAVKVNNRKVEPAYTETQGQYLACIYYYAAKGSSGTG